MGQPEGFHFDWKESLASVKNTFIHVSENVEVEWWDPARPLKRSTSSPDRLQSLNELVEAELSPESSSSNEEPALLKLTEMWDFSTEAEDEDLKNAKQADLLTKMEQNLLAHQSGNCKPCSYFYFKEDGCRNGDNCDFCHFCSPQAVKDCKRAFKRDARREKRAQAAAGLRKADGVGPPYRHRVRGRQQTASTN